MVGERLDPLQLLALDRAGLDGHGNQQVDQGFLLVVACQPRYVASELLGSAPIVRHDRGKSIRIVGEIWPVRPLPDPHEPIIGAIRLNLPTHRRSPNDLCGSIPLAHALPAVIHARQ